MKENGYKMPSEQEEEQPQIKVKQKTKKEVDLGDNIKKWDQEQQKCLEDALARYPKGCADRWDRIAEHVPNKTKASVWIFYIFKNTMFIFVGRMYVAISVFSWKLKETKGIGENRI